MLKEIAIADAYGAGFEFSSAEKIQQHNNLLEYVSHDLYGFLAKYTDDTQMSIAVAEVMLETSVWTAEVIASSFVRCFKRDSRRGYSKGLFQLLDQVDNGAELIALIHPVSDRNGAAMRSVPIGYFRNKAQVIQFATTQAKITHNTEMGIKSSCAVALVAHFGLILKGNISNIKDFLVSEGFSGWNYQWCSSVTVDAYETVSAALTCLHAHRTLTDLLKACVDLGGDTDSVASIAVGLACCFDEYQHTLPVHLIDKLDESEYGINFLVALEERLKTHFLLQTTTT